MKKFNWGWGIILACAGFITFISTLVYKASQEKIEFVTENYYEKELQFQQQIDHLQNAEALPENISLAQGGDGYITISYPETVDWKAISGNVTFFKPDNAELDFDVKAACNEHHRQQISTSQMTKGLWKVKISWSAFNTPYYFEEKIFVN